VTRKEISERAALLTMAVTLKLTGSGADMIEAATDEMVKFYHTTLQEAARAVCGDCAAGVQALPQTAEWEYGHPDGDGYRYRYDCAAAQIHGLIAELDKEADK